MKPEIIYGIHPVKEALAASRRRFFEAYVARRRSPQPVEDLLAQLAQQSIPVKKIPSAQLDRITGTDAHQGIVASVGPYPTVSLQELMNQNGQSLILLLDNVVDPRNLGAIIRTGLCAGVDGIVIPKKRAAMPTPLVSKASAGALEHMHLAKVTNLSDTIDQLKQNGFWVAGLEKNTDQSLYQSDLSGDLAIVLGSEGRGIRPLVREHCDFLISIPQQGQVSSLNVSVAAGVFLYEVYRQRMEGKKD